MGDRLTRWSVERADPSGPAAVLAQSEGSEIVRAEEREYRSSLEPRLIEKDYRSLSLEWDLWIPVGRNWERR